MKTTRLIDADALVSALNNGRLKEQTGRAVPFNAGVAFALTMVEYAPTIDAVPVVRCKDCFLYGECKAADGTAKTGTDIVRSVIGGKTMSDYEYGKCSSCEYEKKPKDELPCKVCTYSCCKWTRKSTDKLERAIGYLNDIGWMQEHDKELTQRTWIPCEERLPEPTQEVLVTGTNSCVYTSRIVHGEFEYGGNVVAWMPLPEPYKEERRGCDE